MEDILIVGAGGLGKEIVDLIRQIGNYNIVGFLDDDITKKGAYFNGVPVLGTIGDLQQFRQVKNLVLAVANPALKYKLYEYSKICQFTFPNLIHPSVLLGISVTMGQGNVICANSILSTEVTLKDFITINPQCGIGHEIIIGSYSTLYWNVHLGGNTRIDASCELGTHSCIIQGLQITDHVIVGAGAVVVKDIDEPGTYVGVPARRIQ